MPQGSSAPNPIGNANNVDANVLTVASTTVNTTVSSGTSLVVASATGFNQGDTITVDNATVNAETFQIDNISGNTFTVNPAIAKTHTATTSIVAKAFIRQITTLGDPVTYANQMTVDTKGNAHIAPQDTIGTPVALNSLAASAFIALTSGQAGATCLITGTWTGTLSFTESIDGINYTPLYGRTALKGTTVLPVPSNQYSDTGSGTIATFKGASAGAQYIRVSMTSYTSGTATVTLVGSAGTNIVLAGSGISISDPVTPGTLASVNAAGTTGTNALAVQGIASGVPMPVSSSDTSSTFSLPLSAVNNLTTLNLGAGQSTLTIGINNITGTGATVVVEGLNIFASILTVFNESGTIAASSITSNSTYVISVAGFLTVRLRVTVAGTGTATGTFNASTGLSQIAVNWIGGLPIGQPSAAGTSASGNILGIQGVTGGVNLPTTVATALPTGGNTIGAVTQASGPWTNNLTQVNTVSLGSPTALGTGASGNVLTFQGGAAGVPLPTTYEPFKVTYAATSTGLAGVAGDFFLIQGSATKTVRIRRVTVSGVASTAAFFDLQAIIRTTADTSGTTGTAPTIGAFASASAAASATAKTYTVAPTTGTQLSIVSAQKLLLLSSTAATTNPQIIIMDFGNGRNSQSPVLSGVAQQFCLNLSAAPATGSIDVTVEWTEE